MESPITLKLFIVNSFFSILMSMHYHLYLFDMDGTLLDSMKEWKTLTSKLMRLHHITLTDQERKTLDTLRLSDSVSFLQERGLPLSGEEFEEWMEKTMREFYTSQAQPKKGADALVSELKERGKQVSVCSLTPKSYINDCFRRLGWEHLLTRSYFGADKRKCDIFYTIAEQFHCTPAQILVFEDSPHAIKLAKQAGCTTVALYDRYTNKGKTIAESDFSFNSLEEFMQKKKELIC